MVVLCFPFKYIYLNKLKKELSKNYEAHGYCKNHNADITIKEKVDGESDRKLYDKEDDGFDRKTTNMMLKNKRFTQVHFWLRREGGCWGKSPTIDIYEVRPILRMYKINLYGCINNHTFNNLSMDEFEKSQLIDLKNIKCGKCNEMKSNTDLI